MLEGKDLVVCALLYGDYPELHNRLIGSMLTAIPPATRVKFWLNQVCQSTFDLVMKLPANYEIHTTCPNNTPKYQAMRQMFQSVKEGAWRWVLWLDDDTWFNKPDWFKVTADYLERKQMENICYVGQTWFVHHLPGQEKFIADSPWYHGRPSELIQGKPGVNFHTGGYVLLRTDLLKRLDWPDVRLSHNGGDTLLGSAVWQLGWPRHHFDYGIKVNDAKRRGRSEAPAGSVNLTARR